MKFSKFLEDLAVISKLGDNPGADNGLTSNGLKAKFDEAAQKLQAFLNDVLITNLNAMYESGELIGPQGPQGLAPTVETERFDDGIQSGVKLIVTNPGTGNQLDQVTVTRIMDGANGMTPRIGSVAVEMLEPEEAATGSISGITNNLTLALRIPRGDPGRDGLTPWIRTAGFQHTDGRSGTQIEIYDSGSSGNPSQTVKVYDGKDGEQGPQGEPGKSPTISTYPFRESDGSTGVSINVNNPDGTIQVVKVYDGKDYTPTPVFFTISGDDRAANAGLYPYEDTSRYATAEELLDAYFGGGAYVVYHKNDPRQGPNQIVGFVISNGNANALAKDPAADSWALKAYKVCTEDEFCSARAKYLT